MNKSDFYYELPEELIAQTPLQKRDTSRLMLLDKRTGQIQHSHFYNLPDFLKKGDCLVMNDSRVLPARLIGRKKYTGGHIELLLLRNIDSHRWECLVKPGKKIKMGTKLVFGDNELEGTIVDVIEGGIANDRVFNTIELYSQGLITQDTALSRLQYESPNNQICLLSQAVVDGYLHFIESSIITLDDQSV